VRDIYYYALVPVGQEIRYYALVPVGQEIRKEGIKNYS